MNTKNFTIDVKGSVTGEHYKGLFKIKPLLSHKDKLRRDEIRRSLLGERAVDASENAQTMASIFSKIYIHLIDAPSWWTNADNGSDLLDEEPVQQVLTEVLRIENEQIDSVKKAGEEAKKELAAEVKKDA